MTDRERDGRDLHILDLRYNLGFTWKTVSRISGVPLPTCYKINKDLKDHVKKAT